MLIKKVQVNNFGKLKNLKIELKKGINLVYGENESGKSTLLEFLTSIFYGINKNSKYTPWGEGEFSGKISYELDNGEEFEVYRDFTKRNPQIFDKNANEISKTFMIDKQEGSKFFYEQTKLDKEMFNMTNVIHQQEIVLDTKEQNTLIQKLSNIILTGEDNISYQKVLDKLSKKQTEEVGTLKSPTKPLYMAKQNVEELEKQKAEIEKLISAKFKIEEEIRKEQKEKNEEEETLKILQELENIHNESKIEKEKINMQKKEKSELEKSLEEMKKKQEEDKKENRETKKTTALYLIPVIFIIITIVLFFMQKILLVEISGIISIISLIGILIKNIKTNKKYRKEQEQKKQEMQKIQNKKEIIQNEIKSKEKIIEETQNTINYKIKMQKERIKAKYPSADKHIFESFENNSNILEEQNYINDLKFSISKKEYKRVQIIEELEKVVEIEEKLAVYNDVLQELIEYDETIEIAKEALNRAYLEMKETITPEFTENLSKSIYKITSGKYKKVKVNEENQLMVETANR